MKFKRSIRRRQNRAHRMWRTGEAALLKLQSIVDKMVMESEANTELVMSGLPDLKLRVNKEVRENVALELKYRREDIELRDIEDAHRTGRAAMLQLKSDVEEQLRQLVALGELRGFLGTVAGTTTAGKGPPDMDNGTHEALPGPETHDQGNDQGTMGSQEQAPSDDTEDPSHA